MFASTLQKARRGVEELAALWEGKKEYGSKILKWMAILETVENVEGFSLKYRDASAEHKTLTPEANQEREAAGGFYLCRLTMTKAIFARVQQT